MNAREWLKSIGLWKEGKPKQELQQQELQRKTPNSTVQSKPRVSNGCGKCRRKLSQT